MRECVEILAEGLRLRGTVHQPAQRAANTAVLIFNSGFLPRSAQGDLLARLSDKLAADGFLAFRFDLPGLGDSEGDLPEDAVTFVRSVEQGAFAPYVAALVPKLVEQYRLDKIVIGGLCGGGMTAMFGAAAAKGNRIAGLMAFDPNFNLVQVQEPQQAQQKPPMQRMKEEWSLRFKAAYEELRIRILATRLGAPVQKIYGRWKAAKNARRASVPAKPRAKDLPKETNHKLVQTFERLAKAGLPMLVVSAHDPRRAASFDYLEYVLRNGRHQVDCRAIEGTNHSFLEGGGTKALLEVVSDWMSARFAPGRAAVLKENVREPGRTAPLPLGKAVTNAR